MRCAGSIDNHRVRIRTCPSEGRGIGASFQRTSSPVNLPVGRAFKIHWRFLFSGIGYLPPCLAARVFVVARLTGPPGAAAALVTMLLPMRPTDHLTQCPTNCLP